MDCRHGKDIGVSLIDGEFISGDFNHCMDTNSCLINIKWKNG